jgi:hypothetical protein
LEVVPGCKGENGLPSNNILLNFMSNATLQKCNRWWQWKKPAMCDRTSLVPEQRSGMLMHPYSWQTISTSKTSEQQSKMLQKEQHQNLIKISIILLQGYRVWYLI